MKYDHLIGIQFDIEKSNCYQLLRKFYRDNYSIELSDYACPTSWWEHEMDLFAALADDEGFEIITSHPNHWKPGDVIIMAINSSRGNHCAVLLDNGKILHHLYGCLSTVTPYGGTFRNTTVGVYRHKLVPKELAESTVDIRELLPLHVRRRIENQTSTGS